MLATPSFLACVPSIIPNTINCLACAFCMTNCTCALLFQEFLTCMACLERGWASLVPRRAQHQAVPTPYADAASARWHPWFGCVPRQRFRPACAHLHHRALSLDSAHGCRQDNRRTTAVREQQCMGVGQPGAVSAACGGLCCCSTLTCCPLSLQDTLGDRRQCEDVACRALSHGRNVIVDRCEQSLTGLCTCQQAELQPAQLYL